MKFNYILSVVGLAALFSSVGFAKEPLTMVEMIDHLEEAVRDCDWKARNLTGAPKNNMLLHKRTMDDVLERLKAGREVDLRKLEEALKVHPS
jgi:hypothetical protein